MAALVLCRIGFDDIGSMFSGCSPVACRQLMQALPLCMNCLTGRLPHKFGSLPVLRRFGWL